MSCEEDNDEDIVVVTESQNTIYIQTVKKVYMVKLFSFFRLKEGSDRTEILQLVNLLNHQVIFSRFSMPKDDVLLSEYFLSYKGGLDPYQLINSLRLFEKITWAALRLIIPKRLYPLDTVCSGKNGK